MRKIYAFVIAIAMFSCSSDENPSNSNPINEIKLLRSVKSVATWLQYQSFNSYHYENSRLTKMYNSSMFRRYQLTYQNDKIWRIAGEYYDWDQENPNVFHEDFSYEIAYPGQNGMGEITYQGNNVYRTYHGGETWSLDDDGKPIMVQTDRDELEGVYEYVYDSAGKFQKKVRTYMGQQYEYRYEFDNKVNPYYILYKQNGFFEFGFSINADIITMDESLFPNNITKVFINNTLVYSAIYEYDGDDYPIKKTVVDNTATNPNYVNNVYEIKYF